MSDLPPGWAMSTVGDAGRVELGLSRGPARHDGPNMKPYLRVANVFEDRFALEDIKRMNFTPAEFERYSVQPGDVLLNEGQTPELLGRPALWRGEPNRYAFTNSLLRFQASAGITPEWALLVFRHYMHSRRFSRETRITTNIAHLSAGRFKSIEFPVPPLAEQHRIVLAAFEHRKLQERAESNLTRASHSLARLQRGWNVEIRSANTGTPRVRFDDLVESVDSRRVPLKRADRQARPGPYRYFGAQGVIDTVDDYIFDGEHLLVAEDGANLASRVKPIASVETGRFWVNNHAHVYRARGDISLHYLALILNADPLEGKITGTAQPKLTAKALNSLPVPAEPYSRQLEIVTKAQALEATACQLRSSVANAIERATQLDRRILTAAVNGELTAQDPADEPASALLERVRAEGAGAAPTKPARRRPSSSSTR